jgi:hypothetical protein
MVGQSGSRSALERRPSALPLPREAVAQTLGEAVRSFLRLGSEIGHPIRHARFVRPDVVTPTRSGGRLSDRAAAFPRRLYATASRERDSPAGYLELPRFRRCLDASGRRPGKVGFGCRGRGRRIRGSSVGRRSGSPCWATSRGAGWPRIWGSPTSRCATGSSVLLPRRRGRGRSARSASSPRAQCRPAGRRRRPRVDRRVRSPRPVRASKESPWRALFERVRTTVTLRGPRLTRETIKAEQRDEDSRQEESETVESALPRSTNG